jgi:Meckel syndrome type 1 protein
MDSINAHWDVIVATVIVLISLILAMVIWSALSRRVRGRHGQRLGISEYHEIDQARRLVLVRRDDTEHLLLIGGPQDVVIETGIGIPARASFEPAALPREGEQAESRTVGLRPAPRPPVFGERRPPLRSIPREEPQLASPRGPENEPSP